MPLEQLKRLATPTSTEELARLRRRVATHLDVMEEGSFVHEDLDLNRARRIAASLAALAAQSTMLDAEQRALLAGAMRYFVKTDDVDDDLGSADGMRDDALVLNEVCELLGRPDLTVT